MPASDVFFYKDDDGRIPIYEWLNELGRKNRKAVQKCQAWIRLLENHGYELKRPYVDYLREGIYELRVSFAGVQYRMLYFFHEQNLIILTHGLIKEKKVPAMEIDRALEWKKRFETNPDRHLYRRNESWPN